MSISKIKEKIAEEIIKNHPEIDPASINFDESCKVPLDITNIHSVKKMTLVFFYFKYKNMGYPNENFFARFIDDKGRVFDKLNYDEVLFPWEEGGNVGDLKFPFFYFSEPSKEETKTGRKRCFYENEFVSSRPTIVLSAPMDLWPSLMERMWTIMYRDPDYHMSEEMIKESIEDMTNILRLQTLNRQKDREIAELHKELSDLKGDLMRANIIC